MTTSSHADEPVNSMCAKCGAAITPTAKFCSECGATQIKPTPAAIKCITCGVEIPESASFCYECGAERTASPTVLSEQGGKVLPVSTASSIESHSTADPPLSSATANQPSAAKALVLTLAIMLPFLGITAFWAFWHLHHPTSANAQYSLGLKYEMANGYSGEVIYWYREAAEQGDAQAQNKLGEMYLYGRGFSVDAVQAASWFRKAAEQGDKEGEYNLGMMYLNGQGITKDIEQADQWLGLAAGQSYEPAREALNRRNQETSTPVQSCLDGPPPGHYSGNSDLADLMGCSYGYTVDATCSVTCDEKPVDVRIVP